MFQASVRDCYILRLRSVLFNTFILSPPVPPVSIVSRYLYLPSSSYRPPISSRSSLYHLYIAPAPHLLYRGGSPSTWMPPTPASLQPPPFASAPSAACLSLPPFPASVCPSFVSLGLRPGPYQPLGGFSAMGPSVSLVSLPLHPFLLRRFTESSGYWSLYQVSVFARGQGARAYPLPGNRSPRPPSCPLSTTTRSEERRGG